MTNPTMPMMKGDILKLGYLGCIAVYRDRGKKGANYVPSL